MLKCFVGIIVIACLLFYASTSFALSIFVDSFTIAPDLVINHGNGTSAGGTSAGASADGGVSVATFFSASSSSSASWLWPFGWGDYSNAQRWHNWRMECHFVGDPGEEAEIIADWRFWAFPVLTAYPSGLKPSSNTATATTSMYMSLIGNNVSGFFQQSLPMFSFYDQQQVMWMGASGHSEIESGVSSLGIFSTDTSNYLRISGSMFIDSECYSNQWGSGASNAFGSINLTLTPISQDDITPGPEPAPVPEPATMLLFGPVLAGLVFSKKRRR